MPEFSYQAIADDGSTVAGTLSAEDVSKAITDLESRGLSVESISLSTLLPAQGTPLTDPNEGFSRHQRVGSSMLDIGFDAVLNRRDILIPALTALVREMPVGKARREIRQLVRELDAAKTATDLRRSRLAVQWMPLLATGFTNPSSTQRISNLIGHASRESQNRRQRRFLLAYPIVVALIVLIVFSLLCAIVVPTFGNMFDDFGLRLPPPTRLVVGIADQMNHHFVRFVLVAISALAIAYGLARLWVHFALTTRLLGVFTAGNSTAVSAMSSLTSQLAELLSIDVSLPDALWLAGQGCQHYHFKNVAEELARDAHRGTSPLSQSPIAHNLPANLIFALEAGPDGRPNIPLLRELSEIYADRANQRVDWSTGALAQFAIIAIGLAVAFIVIALFSPLLSLITGLS